MRRDVSLTANGNPGRRVSTCITVILSLWALNTETSCSKRTVQFGEVCTHLRKQVDFTECNNHNSLYVADDRHRSICITTTIYNFYTQYHRLVVDGWGKQQHTHFTTCGRWQTSWQKHYNNSKQTQILCHNISGWGSHTTSFSWPLYDKTTDSRQLFHRRRHHHHLDHYWWPHYFGWSPDWSKVHIQVNIMFASLNMFKQSL